MANTCISKHRDGRFCHWHRIVIFHADFRSMVMLNPRIKAGSVQFGDNWRILIFFFLRHFSTAIGHMVRSPVLEGGGWSGGVVSSRFGEEIEKRGRVTIGVVGGAQG